MNSSEKFFSFLTVLALTSCASAPQKGEGDSPLDARPQSSEGFPTDADAAPPDDKGADASSPDGALVPSDIGSSPCSGRAPSFATAVVPILIGCKGTKICHHDFAFPNLAYNALIDVPSTETCSPPPLVTAGAPDRSYLVNKITGKGICKESARMPLGRPALSAEEIQTITDWICSGAKNN